MFDRNYYKKLVYLEQDNLLEKLNEYADLYHANELTLDREKFEFLSSMFFALRYDFERDLLPLDLCKQYIVKCTYFTEAKRYSMWKVIRSHLEVMLKHLKEINNLDTGISEKLGRHKLGQITLGPNIIISASPIAPRVSIEVLPGVYDAHIVRVADDDKGVVNKQLILLKADHTDYVSVDVDSNSSFEGNGLLSLIDESYYMSIANKEHFYEEMGNLTSTESIESTCALINNNSVFICGVDKPATLELYKDKKMGSLVGIGLVIQHEDKQ